MAHSGETRMKKSESTLETSLIMNGRYTLVHVPGSVGFDDRDFSSRDALVDQGNHGTEVEQSVDPDENLVGPVDTATAARHEDLRVEQEYGKLGKQDADAVHD
jgi:hypothetical protein